MVSLVAVGGSGAKGQRAATIAGGAVKVTMDAAGTFRVADDATHLSLTGRLPEGAGAAKVSSGTDAMGAYRQVKAMVGSGGRSVAMRVYAERNAVLLLDAHEGADANVDPFPAFQAPEGLERFSYQVKNFSPIEFGKLNSQGPWVFFDHEGHAVVVSPADNFLVAAMGTTADGQLSSGVDATIKMLPMGFAHGTLVVFGSGVNQTLDAWGAALQAMNHKAPIANDADVVLNSFGYWTDNGAKYYYKFDPKLGYEGTLLAVSDQFKQLGVPLAYMQLDSWWYPKEKGFAAGSDNGALVYRADPTILPDGLDGFHERVQMPLVTHARWFAASSPYRKEFRMSKDVVIDPKFWDSTAAYLHEGGVVVYEQDWLDINARPAIDLNEAHAYVATMAEGMAKEKIAIQYCMPLPGYFMASTQFQNLRTIRTSDDRFLPARYDKFLYTSELAHAVGLWPWADVFMSDELSNLVVSTLSAGPVGTGDSLGTIDVGNLKRALRADSVILKPDVPLTPIDAMYAADAADGAKGPMIAATRTNFGDATETYVFSYPRAGDRASAQVSLGELGLKQAVYAWDWKAGKGALISAGGSLPLAYEGGWAYEVLAPVNRAGLALVGDTSKIVPLARKRFTEVRSAGMIEARMTFVAGEDSMTLNGYAEHTPKITAVSGKASGLQYDAATHAFSVVVAPGDGRAAEIRIR